MEYVVFIAPNEVQVVRLSDNAIVARYGRQLYEVAEWDATQANGDRNSKQGKAFWAFSSGRVADFNFMAH